MVSQLSSFNQGIKFSQNYVFKVSNMMLNAKIKFLIQQGKQNVKHKPDIPIQVLGHSSGEAVETVLRV